MDPETGAGAYLIEGKGNGGILAAILFSIVFALVVLALAAPILTVGFAALAAATSTTVAAAVALIVSGFLLWLSAEKNLNDHPCAQMISKEIGMGMITLPWGLSAQAARAAISWEALSPALAGAGLGAADAFGDCLP